MRQPSLLIIEKFAIVPLIFLGPFKRTIALRVSGFAGRIALAILFTAYLAGF